MDQKKRPSKTTSQNNSFSASRNTNQYQRLIDIINKKTGGSRKKY